MPRRVPKEADVVREREARVAGPVRCGSRLEIIAYCALMTIASLVEAPSALSAWRAASAPLSFKVWATAYACTGVLPGALLSLAALCSSRAWPRRLFAQWVLVSVPVFVAVNVGYVMTYAHEFAAWACDPAVDFRGVSSVWAGSERAATAEHAAAVDACAAFVGGWLPQCWPSATLTGLLFVSTAWAAYEHMRCHPGNDGKGVFFGKQDDWNEPLPPVY